MKYEKEIEAWATHCGYSSQSAYVSGRYSCGSDVLHAPCQDFVTRKETNHNEA